MERSWASQAFILIFLAIQIALPFRVLLEENIWPSGGYVPEFSWNMYARNLSLQMHYELQRPNGRRVAVDQREGFENREIYRVLHPSRLPLYHRWLCEQLAAQGRKGKLTGRVQLTPRYGEPRELVEQDVDLCNAPNSGVLEP